MIAMRKVQLRDAKSGLSGLVDAAVDGRPAVITRHGRPEAVILGFTEYKKLSNVPSFGRLLMAAPVGPKDIPKRSRKSPRAVDF